MAQTPPATGGPWKSYTALRQLKLLGIVGWSGAGKTTLIEKLLPALAARGLAVSTIKHTHHAVDLDQPGKDSFRHRAAGAVEVMLASSARFALLRETPRRLSLDELVARMARVDLILVEGFKMDDLPKIEVFREALRKPSLWPETPGIVAIATDAFSAFTPRVHINDAATLADQIVKEGWGRDAKRPTHRSWGSSACPPKPPVDY